MVSWLIISLLCDWLWYPWLTDHKFCYTIFTPPTQKKLGWDDFFANIYQPPDSKTCIKDSLLFRVMTLVSKSAKLNVERS